MAQNGGILACLTAFWTPKFYSRGTSAPFRAIRPPLEAYWAGKHTGKHLKAIATCIVRMQPLLGSKMLPGAPSGPACQNTVFDISGAPTIRLGHPKPVPTKMTHTTQCEVIWLVPIPCRQSFPTFLYLASHHMGPNLGHFSPYLGPS